MSRQRPRPAAPLVVVFHGAGSQRPAAWWEATRKTGGIVRGGYMPIGRGVIPHDLAHLATEGVLGLTDGFWGLLARGATYRHGTRQRPTQRGRALVRDHRDPLREAEELGNLHHARWLAGEETPVGPTFDRLSAAWAAIGTGGRLIVTWPTLHVEEACADAR